MLRNFFLPMDLFTGSEERGESQENTAHLPESSFPASCRTCNLKHLWNAPLHFCSFLQMPSPEAEVSQGCRLNPEDFVFIELVWYVEKLLQTSSPYEKMKHNSNHVLLPLSMEFLRRKLIGASCLAIVSVLVHQYRSSPSTTSPEGLTPNRAVNNGIQRSVADPKASFSSLLFSHHTAGFPCPRLPVGLSQKTVRTGLCTLSFTLVAPLQSRYCCSLVHCEKNKIGRSG